MICKFFSLFRRRKPVTVRTDVFIDVFLGADGEIRIVDYGHHVEPDGRVVVNLDFEVKGPEPS